LVCAAYPPEFDRDSGSRRLLDLIELLVADGWAVSFIAAQRMGDVRYTRTLQQMGVGVFDGAKIRSEEFLATLCFDLALLSPWTVAEIYAPLLRRVSPQTRIVVDSVDLCFLRNARRLLRVPSGNGITSSLDSNYASEFIRELNIYAAADAVLTVSPKEADLVNDMIGDPKLAQVVPDLETPVGSRVALNERRGIVFVGSFRHAPNLDAVEFFCNDIVPLLDPALTARHPIYIIGEGLTDEVRKLADGLTGVRMVGWVSSVKPYLERARVAVAPLRYGAGTKRKLLQMILSGTAAVSSTIGVEGFNLKDGEQVLIADEPEPFAKAITRLLTDDSLWSQLVERGRTHLLTTHSREAVQLQLREVIKGVLAAKPKTDGSETAEKPKPARLDMQSYAAMREKIRSLVESKLPPQAKVIVVSRGDDELLNLNGRTAWHFPQNGEGVYAGHHPENGAEAVAQLEALRARGAEYLLLPGTQFWWLDHYREFRDLLETNYAQVTREEGVCAIYRLAPQASVSVNGAEVTSQNGDLSTMLAGSAPATKLIAFYLPQFHAIPENDAWWGKGFTEWTNVRKAMPQFPGHHQPQVPEDLGYYDLQFAKVRRAQADLAREHGIHGFCYYHYWFNGRRLLEHPFTEVLASGDPDFPFCLCWANEPWTRRWDGREKHILQPQSYSPQDDLNHIRALLPSLADPRAIRIEGRPVFLVYQGRDLPDPARTIEMWRREVERAGLPGIYLMCVETGRDAGWDATQAGFDAKVLFQPQFTTLFNSGAQLPIPGKESLRVFDYQTAWPVLASSAPPAYRHYHTVCPGWDNSPRSGENAVVLHNSSPESYEQWLRSTIANAQAREPEHRIVFINAWNE
jgi:glycosyltransferase involved in cell wall biosynthesis